MGGTGRIVEKEGLVGIQRVDGLHVVDRVIRHGRDQVEVGIVIKWVDIGGVADQVSRLPLAGVAAHEPVEIVEAHADRPLVVRPDLLVTRSGVLWFLPNHEVT